jgi:hypothetical protein
LLWQKIFPLQKGMILFSVYTIFLNYIFCFKVILKNTSVCIYNQGWRQGPTYLGSA